MHHHTDSVTAVVLTILIWYSAYDYARKNKPWLASFQAACACVIMFSS